MTGYEALLRPLRLRQLTLRNRIVSTAHAPGYGVESLPKERYRRYHEEKAKGGIALTMIGGSTAVSPDAVAPFGQLTLAEDRAIPYIRELVDAVHSHGAACFCQISHPGRRGRWDAGSWLPAVGPSRVREPQHRAFPKEMEDWDFERILADYEAAGRRCREAGLDGAELLFAGGHLLLQFLSPAVNLRTDEYGGSLENRLRFALEVIGVVRRGMGDSPVLGIRITADEFLAEGLHQDECIEIARVVAATGAVDYLSVMASQPYDWRSSTYSMPSMAFPLAPYLSMAAAIRAAVAVPVLHAGRILDLATAARAVEEGMIDLVAMTRAQIADPHMVRKLIERRENDIRPCVGANYCINRIYTGGEALCLQNAATGREATMPHVIPPADVKKSIVVVGGGPAGLEAARVCAERGHKVTLIEAEPQVGGQINIATKLGWREALLTIPQWLEGQCRKLDVDMWLGYSADVAMVERFEPDVVVVATGGYPNVGEIEGAEHVLSTWDILGGHIKPGERVLMFDDQGSDSGMSCADYLSQQGIALEVVTPERHLGVETGVTTFPTYLEHLYERRTIISPDLRLRRVEQRGNRLIAVLRNEYTLKEETREVDQVVSDHGTLPDEDLYLSLKPRSRNCGAVDYHALVGGRPQQVASNAEGRYMLFRVGDAIASRNIHAALYDSLRLCKDL
ncbi:FAD-dependent oxidoreductase [Microbaculum marinum]|uniref:FAD-dependent oxidoreductase n=1 Tax=Microbaculum marinum TaxID=1764581 RepID=A0AAW9RDV8_9HYPH